MDLLFLTRQAQQFKIFLKDRLYYNRFEYAMGFCLDEVSCLRELDHVYIDTVIERRQAWREVAQQRWHKANNTVGHILSHRRKEITDQTITNLHELADVLISSECEFKLVVSINQGYVYTNNPTLIDQLDQLTSLTHRSYTRAVITRPRDTIQLKNPRHQYRSYFRLAKLTADQKAQLVRFLQNQQENVRLSPALEAWIDHPFNRTQDYFFVDYDSVLWLTMLALVHPGLIRKTMQIIPTK